MKVILKSDVPKLGNAGDIITVKDGYARNFLIPKGLAEKAELGSVRAVENLKKVLQQQMEKKKKEAIKLRDRLMNISCTITRQAGEGEKIFGSVTTRDIEEALKIENIHIDRKNIMLEEPIKQLGIFEVPVKLHKDVEAKIKVWVVAK
ncbi:MAG: 50S ribosomal protein L9 [Deltaproteobacteria bacterium]|nr:50S ribosomal protein L9 [Deltaproteobacteria bacterium]